MLQVIQISRNGVWSMLCIHEKYEDEVLTYPDQEEFLNKQSEFIWECQHINKIFLSNY